MSGVELVGVICGGGALAGTSGADLLACLFLNPVKLPAGARLWMLLPLVACVAAVYRATRARSPREMPKATVVTFVNIIVGMALIAGAFYVVHILVKAYF